MRLFIVGRQRAGKDSLADYLCYAHGFRKFKIADPFKEIAKEYFGMVGKDRELLIRLAEGGRAIKPLVWCEYLWKRVERDTAHAGNSVVVADVRLPAEVEFFRGLGFKGVRVAAAREVRAQRSGYTAEHENDPTETALDNWEFPTIVNEGTSGELHQEARMMLHRLRPMAAIDRRIVRV